MNPDEPYMTIEEVEELMRADGERAPGEDDYEVIVFSDTGDPIHMSTYTAKTAYDALLHRASDLAYAPAGSNDRLLLMARVIGKLDSEDSLHTQPCSTKIALAQTHSTGEEIVLVDINGDGDGE